MKSGDGQTRWIAIRIGIVALLLAAGFVAVAVRVVKLQVVERDRFAGEGAIRWQRYVELPPRRGLITDRNGETLAASADAPSIAANPSALRGLPRRDLARLSRALALDAGTLQRKAQREARFVWLKRHAAPEEAKAAQELKLDSVAVFQEPHRYYTSRNLAAQLVGFVGDDGEGLEGIELAQDDALRGGADRVASVRDARGHAVLDEAPAPEAERVGARVELSIDVGLQLVAEQALGKAVAQARAAAGMLVAMDPATGEVLALANAPAFNPNLPRRGQPMRDRAVADAFEPGSTFKMFTMAGALDAGVLHARDAIDCENGTYRIGRHAIHDHKGLGWAGPQRILVNSSNVGAAKIGARLGRERLQRTLLAFGFGERTGVEVPGEAKGVVPVPRADIALATMSFGQGVTATPLQITTAVSAIANGGMLMRPIVVRRVVDGASGAVLSSNEPMPVRRAVSRETAALLRTWLESVVTDPEGTGKKARIEGWRVAGKTGTAQKADPVTRRYSVDKRFSSFVGFAPADAPRIVVGVFIDEPRGEVYGGEVAAPVFREVTEHALKSLGVQPSSAPVAAAAPAGEAPAAAPGSAAPAEADADAEPTAGIDDEGALAAPEDGGGVAVPALAGFPARLALRELEARDLAADLRGSGRVTSQSPRPGEVVARGARVRLVLAPPRASP